MTVTGASRRCWTFTFWKDPEGDFLREFSGLCQVVVPVWINSCKHVILRFVLNIFRIGLRRPAWRYTHDPREIEKVGVVVSCPVACSANCFTYESQVVSLRKNLSRRVFVCCDRVQVSKTLEFGILYRWLFKSVFFLFYNGLLYCEQKRFLAPGKTLCFQRRSRNFAKSGQFVDFL